MKPIILLILTLTLSFAGTTVLSSTNLEGKYQKFQSSTLCIDGYKFVFIEYPYYSPELVQMYTTSIYDSNPPQPIKCK